MCPVKSRFSQYLVIKFKNINLYLVFVLDGNLYELEVG